MDGYKQELCKSLEKEGGHEELIAYLQNNGINYYFTNPCFHPLVEEYQKLYYILHETDYPDKDQFWQRYIAFDFSCLLTQIVTHHHNKREQKRKAARKRHLAGEQGNDKPLIDANAACAFEPI